MTRMRKHQPAVSVTAQKVMFFASSCLLRLFEFSLANDLTEMVFFSFHAGGGILKPRFGCNDVSDSLPPQLLAPGPRGFTLSPSACFVCSNQRMISRISESLAEPMQLWQGFCLSQPYAVVVTVLFKLAEPMPLWQGFCLSQPYAVVATVLFNLAEPVLQLQGFCSSQLNLCSYGKGRAYMSYGKGRAYIVIFRKIARLSKSPKNSKPEFSSAQDQSTRRT